MVKSSVGKGVQQTGDAVVNLMVYALIIGSLVTASAFATLTILNVTILTTALVTFFGAIVGFIGLVGTFIGLRWLIGAIKGEGKGDSITDISA